MTGDGYTTIILQEGEHHVRIYKEKNKEWFYEGEQTIFVGANSSVKIKIDTDEKATEHRVKRLAQEKREREARLAKEKAWLSQNSYPDVFSDYETKLFWQDDSDAKNVTKPWLTRKNYDTKNYMDTSGDTATTYCKNLKLGNFSDWRLPTKDELSDLYRKKQKLQNVGTLDYWSSTTNASNTSGAWLVGFYYGNDFRGTKTFTYYVRCVRGGQ
jgi:hypothetical protein